MGNTNVVLRAPFSIIQASFVWQLPISTFHYYLLWIFTAVLRTAVGRLLTRSIGWAYPRFFSHWALYEACGGYGPSIVIYIFLFGSPDVMKTLFKRLHKASDILVVIFASALLCSLDNAPRTYGLATLGAGAIVLGLWILRMASGRALENPMMLDGQKHTLTS